MTIVHSVAGKVEIPFLIYLKSIFAFFKVVDASYPACLLMVRLSLPAAVFSELRCFWRVEEVTVMFLLLRSSMCNSFCVPLWFYLL